MTRSKKVLVAVAVVALLLVAAGLALRNGSGRGVEVRIETVADRDLVSTVTANGSIRATRSVDISADVSGRVTELHFVEGQEVEEGELLLRIDPTAFAAAVRRAEAAVSQAEAQVAQQNAALTRESQDLERAGALRQREPGFVSAQQMEEVQARFDMARASLEAARQGEAQARATLAETESQLAKTTIRAPISGKITRRNIELGETVVVGTMNNPGSRLLTIADLSRVEAVMRVDETDIPRISLGDSALVEIDAFPNEPFRGVVTEVGNSAVESAAQGAAGQSSTVDFEVVIVLDDPEVQLRSDLSATADIITEVRPGVPSIPIIALTVRELNDEGSAAGGLPEADTSTTRRGPMARAGTAAPTEGVFAVREGRAVFVPVRIGITGQEHFEVIEGIQVGDSIVSGPYQRIRELVDGQEVRAAGSTPVGG